MIQKEFAVNFDVPTVIQIKTLSTGAQAITLLKQLGASCSDMCKVELWKDPDNEENEGMPYVDMAGGDELAGTWFISGAAGNANLDIPFCQPIEETVGDFVLVMTPMKHAVDCYAYLNGQDS